MLGNLILLVGITLMYSTPLIFGALGGVISERSGVTNIGIEGMMVIGAVAGASASYFTGNPWIGFLAAGVCGALIALLHAVASVTFAADQTVSGVAINMLAPGLALFACRRFFDGAAMSPIAPKLPKILGDNGLAGTPFASLNVNVTTVIALVLTIIMWFVLYKTKWGLRIRAVGEHPAAADTLGIDVYKVRYACVLISGALAGLGGASMTIAIIAQFTQTAISGHGFIAMAAVIFGKWTPFGAYAACLLFGFTQALVIMLGGGNFAVPSQILSMLPYVMTIVVLVLFVGRSVAPKADGVPYIKGSR
ncbi:MAG: ABC transporter permease [Atopobiaceae bacterium]|nr:ABC transporter permease [Atopobiaceae bacterium]